MTVTPDSALPEGTVTFLFTDVEGSTRLFERHAEAYRKALLRHDSVLRDAVESNRGHVFETVGDAFYAVFAEPTDAVAAALGAQIDLADEDWGELGALRIRVGLNTGEVERRGRHYFGHTLYRCARIMATAYGGQIVLSSATADRVRERLPPGASLRSLGTHRLKDLGEPEQIHQLLHPALTADFPPLKSLSTLHNNLPQQVTSFVGRDREMSEISALLGRSRLVTLLGTGGSGKTRLALQVAADALDPHPDGVWFVDLAPLADPALVAQQVAGALGVREEQGRPLAATLEDHLRPKRLLVVLDNCEHLLAACAELASAVLRACPHVRLLATSREALRVAGETAWPVPTLSLPGSDVRITAQIALRSEAVRLFVDRASAVSPGFALDGNAAAVADICRRVEGIPLAIELAAARVRVLAADQIAERLENRFALLTGGSRTALPRQRTLRALVDWSYELLGPDERALFDRLAVFAGGWTLEAAEAACGGAGLEPGEVLDLLSGLVDKSLVVAEAEDEGRMRYRLLETLRQYADERLAVRPEAPTVRGQHAVHFLALAEQAEPELTGSQQVEWLGRLENEHDNLRAALRWTIQQREVELGWRLGGALYRFWSRRGHFSEGRERLDALLALPEGPDAPESARAARAKALHGAATLALLQGESATARSLFEQSLALKRAIGDRSAIAATLNNLAVISRNEGDHRSARALMGEALELYRELGDRWAIAMGLTNLGVIAGDLQETAEARRLYEESLALRRELADKWGIAHALENLGHIALAEGDHDAARRSYTEGLEIVRDLGEKRMIAALLEDFGALAAASGDARLAVRRVSAAAALRETIASPLPPTEQARVDRYLDPARQSLGPEAVADEEAAGRATAPEAAIADALGLR